MTVRILINRAGPLRAPMIDMLRSNPDGVGVEIHATRPGGKSYALAVADVAAEEPDNDASDREYADWAVQYCADNQIDALFPTTRMTALASQADRFREVGTELMTAADERHSAITDSKIAMYELAKSWGLRVPDFFQVNSAIEFREAVTELAERGYTPTVKVDSGWSADSFRIVQGAFGPWAPDFTELAGPARPVVDMEFYAQALERAKKVPALIVMPFLDDPEISVDVLSDRHGSSVTAVSRRKEGTFRVFSGNELEIEMGRQVADLLGLKYISNVQFRVLDGAPVLLEVNTRAAAGIFHTKMTGVNLPWEAVRLALGGARRELAPDTSRAARLVTSVIDI